MERLRRTFASRDPDWPSTAVAYAGIVLGTGLVVYSLVAL